MKKVAIEEVLKKLHAKKSIERGGGATQDEIRAAEQSLAVSFPPDYSVFLRQTGWVVVEDNEVYGLGGDTPSHMNVVSAAMAERFDAEPPLPERYLPIMNDGGGNHYCFDFERAAGDSCPVVFWVHDAEAGADQRAMKVADNFAAWLKNLMTNGMGH